MAPPQPRLRRPHVTYKVVLKTPLARQLYGMTLGMANALAKLGLTAQHSLPPDQGKRASALAFEILAALRDSLATEQAALTGQHIPRVTDFPTVLRRELQICHAHAIQVMDLLATLDKLARTWYDLWFQGHLSQEEFDRKGEDWKRRFRRASRQINNLSQQVGSRHNLEAVNVTETTPTSVCHRHVSR